jgi:hypothetical protein
MSDFLYSSFRIIAPNNTSQKSNTIFDDKKLSDSANSFLDILINNENVDPDVFDESTLFNIVKKYTNFDFDENKNEFAEHLSKFDDSEMSKKYVLDYLRSEYSSIKIEDNITYLKILVEFVDNMITNEYEGGDIHPKDYPVRYLVSGILYDTNWIYLSDSDLNKFCISYGINLKLTNKEKILEIVKIQNKIFEKLVSNGYDREVRDCPITKKLIQKIDKNGNISIDSEYR